MRRGDIFFIINEVIKMEITSSDRSVTIGTDVVVISEPKQNGERTNITLVNTSTASQVISVSTSGDAQAGSGLVLYAGGSIDKQKSSNLPIIQSRVTAVASAVGATLAVHEEVLQ